MPRILVRGIFDADGKPIHVLPDVIDADFMRSCYRKVSKGELKVDEKGNITEVPAELVRAQIPYLVTMHVYHSALQLKADEQEWYVYAPADLKSAASEVAKLWRRWFEPRPIVGAPVIDDLRLVYPKYEDGVVVEPIPDTVFKDSWRYASKRPHKAAGHPDLPWAFKCLDDDFKLYKYTDRQHGLIHRIT